MTNNSPILDLPYLQPSQAQKHVTHNEALQRLDLVVQLRVQSLGSETPPDMPQEGEIHVLGDAPTEAWTGQTGVLAAWVGNTWIFLEPQPGWRVWDLQSEALWIWDGSAWVLPRTDSQNLEGLGIGTSSDSTNRLAVRADATLLSHAGSDHQLKINKASGPDTASLLFQSGWMGHAEMGLSGTTDFAIKVSSDGNDWKTALQFDGMTGHAEGVAVQADATDTTTGRLMRADYGFGPGNLLGPVSQTGGVPTGAVLESGSNANGDYIRLADGTQLCWESLLHNDTLDGSATVSGTWILPAACVSAPVVITNPYAAINVTAAEQAAERLRGAAAGAADGLSVHWALHNCSNTSQTNARLYLMAVGRWF